MARLPRIVVPGQPLHLVQRGNNRSACFFADEDYLYYLDCLLQAGQRFHCAIHAYVLMTNHVHLLVTPKAEDALPRMMQMIGRRYVRYINSCYRRTGTLWEGRYKSTLIDSDAYLLVCSRYIELNPVRAGMVGDSAAYRWSSYRSNVMGEANPLITPHPDYLALGSRPADRQMAYRALFKERLAPETLNRIRQITHQGTVLGNDLFRAQIEEATQRRITRAQHGGDRRSSDYRERPR